MGEKNEDPYPVQMARQKSYLASKNALLPGDYVFKTYPKENFQKATQLQTSMELFRIHKTDAFLEPAMFQAKKVQKNIQILIF